MARKDPRLGDEPFNYNEKIQDRTIRHMLFLEGLKTREARKIRKTLDSDIIPDLKEQLAGRLARIRDGVDTGPATTRRLELMIAELSNVTGRVRDIGRQQQGDLFDLAIDEAQWQKGVLNQEAGFSLGTVSPSPEQLRAAVVGVPFDGKNLQQWYDSLATGAQTRLAGDIRRGFIEGQTNDQIVRRISRGGFLDTTRRQTDTVVRTAIQHTSNTARNEFFKENEGIIKGVMWIATLDSRTCPTCMSLDRQVFDVGDGPRPPAHAACRCATTAITKSFREMGIDIDDAPDPSATRASMNGQVPRDVSYNQWLKGQKPDIQEMALGKNRGKLFREGNLSVDQFVNRDRVQLTLADLRKREADAFKAADL